MKSSDWVHPLQRQKLAEELELSNRQHFAGVGIAFGCTLLCFLVAFAKASYRVDFSYHYFGEVESIWVQHPMIFFYFMFSCFCVYALIVLDKITDKPPVR